MQAPFLNLSIHQRVNSWLGIALLTTMCFSVVFFYFTQGVRAIDQDIAASANAVNYK